MCDNGVRIDPTIPPGDAPCPHCGHLLWFPDRSDFDWHSRIERYWCLENLDFIVNNAIVRNLEAATASDAIGVLVDRLADAGGFPIEARQDIISALTRREELGSTGIGRGLAVPHAKHACITELAATVGYSASGIPFDSLDGESVHVVFLVLSPEDDPSGYLGALERASQCLRMFL